MYRSLRSLLSSWLPFSRSKKACRRHISISHHRHMGNYTQRSSSKKNAIAGGERRGIGECSAHLGDGVLELGGLKALLLLDLLPRGVHLAFPSPPPDPAAKEEIRKAEHGSATSARGGNNQRPRRQIDGGLGGWRWIPEREEMGCGSGVEAPALGFGGGVCGCAGGSSYTLR